MKPVPHDLCVGIPFHIYLPWMGCNVLNVKVVSTSRCFRPGEGLGRGLLRDCDGEICVNPRLELYLVALPLPLPQLVNAGLGVAELGRPGDVLQTVLVLVQLPQRRRPGARHVRNVGRCKKYNQHTLGI